MPDRSPLQLTSISRRQRSESRQLALRQRECEARRLAAGLQTKGTCAEQSRRLGVSPRTLRHWRCCERQGRLQPRPLGRPCKELPHADKAAALELLHLEGPHLGLPTLRAALPHIPRCQWIELQRDYRLWWRTHHRCGQQRLKWHRTGAVWAIDFSTPPEPINEVYGKILAVRDLASGMQLAWLPVEGETAAAAVEATEHLFRQHGAPLVLKSDNGSAFTSGSWGDLLTRWQTVPLYSPPRRPQYNGSCEASNGAMKLRTSMLATQRDSTWTSELLEDALRQANELHRSRLATNPTAAEQWRQRAIITQQDRERFSKSLDEQREKVHNQLSEGAARERATASQQARLEREAIAQALVELGILTVTWRSIPLPFNQRKAAKIS